jgi:small-conductance mechanosensitive channel
MKRYISTLSASTALFISARIIISHYSQTRRKSPRLYDTVTVRVGNSVVQISNVPLVELLRTLRVTLIALALLPYYIAHAAHLDPSREHPLDFLKKAMISWKTKTLMRRLSKKSILSLTEESIISTASVFGQLHPCRISVPYCPDSRLLAMTMVLRLLEFFSLYTERRKGLQDSDLSTTTKVRS